MWYLESNDNCYSVTVLTETWQDTGTSFYSIEGYQEISQTPGKNKCSGLAVFIKRDIFVITE